VELTWHPAHPAPGDATPTARRARAIALVAYVWPELDPPALDDEPCDGLGGPWCSATWSWGRRTLRATWYPTGARIEKREGMRTDYALARDHREAARAVVGGMVWAMEGGA
jgi:hypothetical protein